MSDLKFYIEHFTINLNSFKSILSSVDDDLKIWKPSDQKWCMLEILCHLVDEEKEDFRRRLRFVVNQESGLPPSINPPAWVEERQYMQQDFAERQMEFIKEREASIQFLNSIEESQLDGFYMHPKLGKLDGHHFISNWLAHDYLHIKQLIRLKYDYLAKRSGNTLDYAGEWK